MDSPNVENAVSSKKQVVTEIPDGGLRAWVIVIASFLTNGLIFGIHNCYGLIYLQLKNQLEGLGINDAPTKACELLIHQFITDFTDRFDVAALVGSLSIGMTFFISPLAGIMIDSFGLRRTAILGGAIASIGMLASSFALQHVKNQSISNQIFHFHIDLRQWASSMGWTTRHVPSIINNFKNLRNLRPGG